MQLDHWKGDFGNQYVERNGINAEKVIKNVDIWLEILQRVKPASILEVGANVGLNLRAIKHISDAKLYAVEPNALARKQLVDDFVVLQSNTRSSAAQSIDFPDGIAELVFTSGVLIHIAPDDLLQACKEIHRCSSKWVACIEYFSDKPDTIKYRGQDDLLFKRDFGSYWLDNFPDLELVDYGFFWKRVIGLDNLNWWIFEKK